METFKALEIQQAAGRRPQFSAINWGAIFAGVVVGLSMNLILNLLGIAAGLMTIDIVSGRVPGDGVSKWAAIWNAASMVIASFVGGYVAARMSGLKRRSDGVLHGFVSWGATTILLTGLFAALAGSLSSQFFGGVGRSVVQQNMGFSSQVDDAGFRRQLDALTMGSGKGQGGGLALQQIQELHRYIQAKERSQAVDFLISNIGFDEKQATTVADQLFILSGSPESASNEAREAANQAVEAATGVTWTLVAIIALSLVLGVTGGALGVAGSWRIPQPVSA